MKLKQIRIDGYKNLISCKVNLGDFNVLVGPNNSGKTNILEAVQMLFPICWGSGKLMQDVFSGLTPRFIGSSICHLDRYKKKPLTLGVSFETTFQRRRWEAEYEVTVQCAETTGGKSKPEIGFRKEMLTAKPCSQTGPVTKYIERSADSPERFSISAASGKKLERKIGKTKSVIEAIESIFPEYEGLSKVLRSLTFDLMDIGVSNVFAVSPDGLRKTIDEEKAISGLRIASFDLLLAIDELYKNRKLYDLFRETMCYILNLDDIHFEASYTKKGRKRVRSLAIKTQGSDYADVTEYSDGTLAVAAILAALFSKKRDGPMLFVEELENCLHPAALERLVRFLQDHADKWPVLITTHSPYLLNYVNPVDVNVAVVDETGAVHFEKVHNTKQLRDYLKSGFMSFGDMLASNFEDVLGK